MDQVLGDRVQIARPGRRGRPRTACRSAPPLDPFRDPTLGDGDYKIVASRGAGDGHVGPAILCAVPFHDSCIVSSAAESEFTRESVGLLGSRSSSVMGVQTNADSLKPSRIERQQSRRMVDV